MPNTGLYHGPEVTFKGGACGGWGQHHALRLSATFDWSLKALADLSPIGINDDGRNNLIVHMVGIVCVGEL